MEFSAGSSPAWVQLSILITNFHKPQTMEATNVLSPKELMSAMKFALPINQSMLIKSRPGVGKSDITEQVTAELGYKFLLTHPAVSDPTDYKGMPFIKDGVGHFVPFNELKKLVEATEPTVLLIDDVGQASPAVQAALMQLILARRVNEQRISDQVRFVACTNRQSDKSGVTGMFHSLKTRFAYIVELEPTAEDWIAWAIANNQPAEMISYVRWMEHEDSSVIKEYIASKEIEGSACPRTLAGLGKGINEGLLSLPEKVKMQMVIGAIGEVRGRQFLGFLEVFNQLPSIDEIIKNPAKAAMPDELSAKYAVISLMMKKVLKINVGKFITYVNRFDKELQFFFMNDLQNKDASLLNCKEFSTWAATNPSFVF